MKTPEVWLIGFLIGLVVGSVLGGATVVRWMDHLQRHQSLQEKIAQHNCQPISIWRNGKEVNGIACRMPDGTIVQR